MSLKTNFFFLAPVEVVKVTSHNLEEVAEWCGGRVAQTESRRKPGTLDSYVWVPTPKGTKISWAFPGMYITKRVVVTLKDELKCTYSVFRRDYFEKNYFDEPVKALDATWGRKDGQKSVAEARQQHQSNSKPNLNLSAEVENLKETVDSLRTDVQHLVETAGEKSAVTEVHNHVERKMCEPKATDEVSVAEMDTTEGPAMTEVGQAQLPDVLKMASDLVAAGVASEEEVSKMSYDTMKGFWLDFRQDINEVENLVGPDDDVHKSLQQQVQEENLGGLDDGVLRG